MTEPVSRRGFLRFTAAAAALVATGAAAERKAPAPFMIGAGGPAPLPRARGPRVVVVGGGTSGLTIAKYAKRENPKFDVVLVEKRDMYSSCFASNLWYAGLIDLDFLAAHSYLDAARNNDYVYFNATCTGLDRHARKLVTNEGEIAYDYLVLAPGIDYDYSRIGIRDIDKETMLRTAWPGGFARPTEHVTIREKIRGFEGGVFAQTVPSGNYRCLPAPYERCCLIAAHIRKHRLKGKVLLLDHNPEIVIKAAGFHAAFDELYKGIIEYVPSTEITDVDPEKRVIKTVFDSYTFDEAAIYPGVRGARLIEQLGLLDPDSLQKEARIDPLRYHVPGDERVYVAGDARPHRYSKSANTANTEGKYIARLIAGHVAGRAVPWTSPRTRCYSVVNTEPMEAIGLDTGYVYDAATRSFHFSPDTRLSEKRDASMGRAALEWARGMYRDLFA
jgi:sulfide dehydrogenase [flavocytochrome c] flavoprotein chain